MMALQICGQGMEFIWRQLSYGGLYGYVERLEVTDRVLPQFK